MDETKKPMIQQGWLRALLYLLLGLSATFALVFVIALASNSNMQNLLKQPTGTKDFLFTYCINNTGFILVAFLMRVLVDRKSFYSLGFQWKGFASDAFTGFFIAVLILCIGSLLLMALKLVYFTGFSFNPMHLAGTAALFIVVAFIEEIIFRGYLLNNLMQSMNKYAALAISALVFALFHAANPDISILSIANLIIAGVLLGINYIYTKNLWFAIFLHFAWNYFQGPVFGYQVSGFGTNGMLQQTLAGPTLWTGGNFGFEGSLLTPVLELMAIALLAKKYGKTVASR